jgi:glutathione synthase/RimK-type ligase-like ATP-grasp enzyme
MGNRVLGAVKRTAANGIKANYCKGGSISLYNIDKGLEENVNRLLNTGYYDFAGFDFLPDGKGGYYFNEIEDAVGSRSLCMLAGIDTAEEYIKYISKILK